MCEATRWMLGASIHRAERSAFWRDARPTSRFSGAGLLAAKRRRGRCRAECGQALAAVHTSGEAGIAGWGFLFLVSGSFNVDKAFHNRAVFRLWKGVLACSCSRVSDWLVGLVWRAVDLEEPRCCGPFARLLESRAKGLRALASERPARIPFFLALAFRGSWFLEQESAPSHNSVAAKSAAIFSTTPIPALRN